MALLTASSIFLQPQSPWTGDLLCFCVFKQHSLLLYSFFINFSLCPVCQTAQIYEVLHWFLEAWCPVTVNVSELFIFFLTIIPRAQFAQSYWKWFGISIYHFPNHRMWCALVKPQDIFSLWISILICHSGEKEGQHAIQFSDFILEPFMLLTQWQLQVSESKTGILTWKSTL